MDAIKENMPLSIFNFEMWAKTEMRKHCGYFQVKKRVIN